MKSPIPIVLALLLMAIGGGIALSKFRGPGDATKSASPPPASHPPAKTNRETGSKLSPEAAAKSLRALTSLDLSKAPNFDEIESLCRRLSDAELQALITEVGFADPGGLLGWLRCGLWAELGRRDPILGFNLLQRTRLAGSHGKSSFDAINQITSSYLRGRITGVKITEASLAELFEEIYILQQSKESNHSIPSSFGLIFGEWAKHDPATAWRSIHGDNPDSLIPKKLYDALKLKYQDYGYSEFFRNLREPADVAKYITEWTGSLKSDATLPPMSDIDAGAAAASLARFDPDTAISWLDEAGPPRKDDERYTTRESYLILNLAKHYPETARQWLLEPDRAHYHTTIASILIQNDPKSAPEVISRLSDPKAQGEAISMSIRFLSNNRKMDLFPHLALSNRLPDFQGRYDAVTEAINTSKVSEFYRAKLHETLREEMAKSLPHLR